MKTISQGFDFVTVRGNGTMTKHNLPMATRLLAQIEYADNDCWWWIGLIHPHNGYGRLKFGKQMEWTHRLAYVTWIGPIPEGLDVGHKCHDRAAQAGECTDEDVCMHRRCINPEHLKAEPRNDNLNDSPLTQASINKAKTHCKRHHEFTPENTRMKGPNKQWRDCRACGKMTKVERDEWDRTHD
jgi:hypothetical protein